MTETNKVIEGIGKDAPIETNAQGGQQSRAVGACHLLDPNFLNKMIQDYTSKNTAIEVSFNYITQYMRNLSKISLLETLLTISNPIECLFKISEVLKEGAEKYSPNNWRLIPAEEHLNHAIIHLLALLGNDTQDDHKGHAMCRLMMCYATKETEGFSYTEPFKKPDNKDLTPES